MRRPGDSSAGASIGVNDPGMEARICENYLMHMDDGSQVVGDTVHATDNCDLYDIYTNSLLGSPAVVPRHSDPTAFSPLPIISSLPSFPSFACNPADDVTLAPSASLTLPPGVYGNLRANDDATLTLQAGTYTFCDWSLGVDVHVINTSGTVVQDAGDWTTNNGTVYGPACDAQIYVEGAQVRFARNTEIHSRFWAPNAEINLGDTTDLFGKFWGNEISSDADDNADMTGCDLPTPPTTTTAAGTTTTTTTVPATTTTTTVPATTTTTVPATTTTVASATTTTPPSPDVPPPPGPTTTTIAPGATTTVARGPPAAPRWTVATGRELDPPRGTLPLSGSGNTGPLLAVAAGFLGGVLMLAGGRRRQRRWPPRRAGPRNAGCARVRIVQDDTLAYIAITRLQQAYGDVSTRRAWAEMTALTTADAVFSYDFGTGDIIELRGASALCEFGARVLQRFSFYQYVPVNTVVDVGADGTAHGRFYVLEVGQERETGDWLDVFGLYHDDYVFEAGTWRFARRQYQVLARRVGGGTTHSHS